MMSVHVMNSAVSGELWLFDVVIFVGFVPQLVFHVSHSWNRVNTGLEFVQLINVVKNHSAARKVMHCRDIRKERIPR